MKNCGVKNDDVPAFEDSVVFIILSLLLSVRGKM